MATDLDAGKGYPNADRITRRRALGIRRTGISKI